MKILLERGIVTQVHYIPIIFHPFYQKNYNGDKFAIINAIVTLGLKPGGWGFSSRNGNIDNLFD